MSESVVILCPGQGAQAVGMGEAWAERSPEARRVLDRADEVLAGRFEAPLSRLCFEGPGEVLNRTDISQPAIFACSMASLAGLCAAWGVSTTELAISAAAGLSLGEYTALAAAGALRFEAGLELVALRGEAMQAASERTESGMLALIGTDKHGDDEREASVICEAARGDDVLVAANFNAPGQVVVSGSMPAIERAKVVAVERGLKATPLPVAGAFHSPLMQPAADRLNEALARTEIGAPRCPVLSNVTGEPHEPEASSIRARLVEQLTHPVRWASNARWVATTAAGEAHELAPGKTLSGLYRRIDRSFKVTTHDQPRT